MTRLQTALEKTRHDAQDLHRKISASIARAEQATWADVLAVQTDVNALGTSIKSLAEEQADSVKAGLKTAITKLEAAGKLAEDKAVAVKDGVRHANAVMLESAHKAAQSLSAALAEVRTRAARAIEPKKVPA